MKLAKLGLGLALGLVAAGCGSSDNTCGDAGCPDGSSALPDGSGNRDASGFTLSNGKYKATMIADPITDGCMINPKLLVDMNTNMDTWIPVEISGGIMKVGNPKGEPPAASLGEGPYVTTGETFKLTRMNHFKVEAPSTCEYDQEVTSTITLDGNDTFGLGVVEKQTNRKMCATPAGVGDSCASTWSWRMVKAQ
jgi:hypothetical protein